MSDTELAKFMTADEMSAIGVAKLTAAEKESLLNWGLRQYELGRHVCEDIEEIKYGGRLVILADGSRWEIDEADSDLVASWGEFVKVVVIDGEMYLLNESDKVFAEQEF